MIATLGGIGLFLLGMMLMTDGIKALAGAALREVLTRFVRGPVTATASGTALTALLQSSSATMLTTIGFVSAGLITFPQAIGVIFGANLGTTSTGWIVSMLGFKLSMGAAALPLVFTGAMLRLLTRGRPAAIGTALAGFGLLFFGIGLMQEGMGGLAERIDLDSFSGEGLLGALVLVGIGVVMTVAMQSSSAAMAVTLAALHTGGIDLQQGAALVIGQNIGTTVTAALASIGASNAAKRTALAHILFNLITGLLAFGLLPAFAWGVGVLEQFTGDDAGVGSLAAFHTAFNAIGVVLFLPFTSPFARLVERLTPERGPRMARHLDASVARLGAVGLEAARRSLTEVLAACVSRAVALVRAKTPTRTDAQRFDEGRGAIPRVASFVARIGAETERDTDIRHQTGLVHAIDHLERLAGVIDRLAARPQAMRHPQLDPIRKPLEEMLLLGAAGMTEAGWAGDIGPIHEARERLADLRKSTRHTLLERIARGQTDPELAGDLIEATRLMDSVAHHVARTLAYLSPTSATDEPPGPETDTTNH
jgi:phosphate:Na+ symporter